MLLNTIELLQELEKGLITPYEESKIRQVNGISAISFGLGGAGYDIRIAPDEIYLSLPDKVYDPKNPYLMDFERVHCTFGRYGLYFTIPPRRFCLAKSVEYFNLPDNIHGIAVGKSTYARCGLPNLITPLEAGWRGVLTLEISNPHDNHVIIYANEGITQIMFMRLNSGASAYEGRYQDQAGTTLAGIK